MCAPLEAEPLPPAGVDQDLLYQAIVAALGDQMAVKFLQWRETDWPAWARRGWRRLEQGQAQCTPSPRGRTRP